LCTAKRLRNIVICDVFECAGFHESGFWLVVILQILLPIGKAPQYGCTRKPGGPVVLTIVHNMCGGLSQVAYPVLHVCGAPIPDRADSVVHLRYVVGVPCELSQSLEHRGAIIQGRFFSNKLCIHECRPHQRFTVLPVGVQSFSSTMGLGKGVVSGEQFWNCNVTIVMTNFGAGP
jgi:hypothetical protein